MPVFTGLYQPLSPYQPLKRNYKGNNEKEVFKQWIFFCSKLRSRVKVKANLGTVANKGLHEIKGDEEVKEGERVWGEFG